MVIVSSGEAIAGEVESRLRATGLENEPGRRGEYRFLATGDQRQFRRLGIRFLQLPVGDVEHVKVDLNPPTRSAA